MQAIKDHGYFGFYNTNSQLPNAIAIFYSLPVQEAEVELKQTAAAQLTDAQLDDIVLGPFEQQVQPADVQPMPA